MPSGLRGVMIRAEWARRRLRQDQWKQIDKEASKTQNGEGATPPKDQQRNNQARGGQKGQSKGKRNK